LGNEVFANGNEIACKSGDGKVIAALPDVCLSPPSPPAGPIPVPYPDTSFSKDMKNGSKTVKIDSKEVMLKDKSFYKTSPLGNEAATKSLGAGVVSHVITGKTYFVAWSMDVKFEGKNVDRHIDLTTSNHASPMGDTPTIPNAEKTNGNEEKPSPTYGLHRDTTAKCYPDGKNTEHDLFCGKYVCPDCWRGGCEKNAAILEEKYTESQAGSNEQEIAESGKAANKKKMAIHKEDKAGYVFENEMIDEVLSSPNHTIEKVGYQVHCLACHLHIDLDIVTDNYVIETKIKCDSFKGRKAQFEDRIIPAVKKCFPEKKIACLTNKEELEQLQTKILDNWDIGVNVLRL